MKVLNKSLDNKTVFALSNSAKHIAPMLDEVLEVKGILFKDVESKFGPKTLGILIVEGFGGLDSYFSSATSYNRKLLNVAHYFKTEIEDTGIKVKVGQVETASGKTAYNIEVL